MPSVYLIEAGHTSPPVARVDRDRGIINDVRVLGWESAQGHGYSFRASIEALRLKLYEGKPVHYQHATPGQRRSVYDVMGMIRSPKLKADGIYADLHYLKSHPKAGELLEAATNPQTGVGLSHVARGTKATHAGRDVIVSIDEVQAVDFCTNPLTNKTLYEGESPMNPKVNLKPTSEVAAEMALEEGDLTPTVEAAVTSFRELAGKLGGQHAEELTRIADKLESAMTSIADPEAPLPEGRRFPRTRAEVRRLITEDRSGRSFIPTKSQTTAKPVRGGQRFPRTRAEVRRLITCD